MNINELPGYLEEYLKLKRTMAESRPHYGRLARNQFNHREKLLRDFFAFWQRHDSPWPIRATLALDWVAVGADCERPYRDLLRLKVVREFLQHVRVFEPETEIPENAYRVCPGRRTPHIFSDLDIEGLMKAAQQHRHRNTLHPLTQNTLIGLLASTGLRIGEVIQLKAKDVQLDADPPHLLIYESKFGKSRAVVLHPSTAQHLRKYCDERARALCGKCAETFFVNCSGRPLEYNTIRQGFLRLFKRAGIQALPGRRAPSPHSFRHTFAVKRLTEWYRERKNVPELLPHLAVYLGHVGPENTYWYVTETPELLQTAAELFDMHRRKGGTNE